MVVAHLIQSVGITPIVKDPDLRYGLYCLGFEQVSRRFGCTFLHNLNLSTAELPEICKKDPKHLLCRMGVKPVVNAKTRKKGQASKPPTLPTTDGVTWTGLKTLLIKEDKKAEILPFQFDSLCAAYSVAQDLFCEFAYQFRGLTPEDKFSKLPKPVTLKDAMECWTVQSVRARIKNEVYYDLTPSADDLVGAVPPKSRTQLFRDKRVAFFPEPGGVPSRRSKWHVLSTIGYVKDYHRALNISVDGGKALRDALDNIFQRLQVLPRKPGLPSTIKPLWSWEGGRLNLLLNSTFIRLVNKNILPVERKPKENRNTGPRNAKSTAQVTEMLLGQKEHTHPKQTKALRKAMMREPSGRDPILTQEEQMVKGSRRGKAKGYREPPKRRLLSSSSQPAVVGSDRGDTGDADEQEDCAVGNDDDHGGSSDDGNDGDDDGDCDDDDDEEGEEEGEEEMRIRRKPEVGPIVYSSSSDSESPK